MGHDHDHDSLTEQDVADLFSQQTWDARYAESDRIWSGRPNPRLVEHVTGVPAGTALDVGAGEGADAVWLAQRGWQVTALDVSEVALERTFAVNIALIVVVLALTPMLPKTAREEEHGAGSPAAAPVASAA